MNNTIIEKVLLNLVVIRSKNLQKAACFYRALGVNLVWEQHGTGIQHLAARVGGVVLELYPSEDGKNTTSVRLGFGVPSLQAVLVAILDQGGSVVSSPRASPWGLRAVVADPDGHYLELVENQPSPT